MAARLNRRPTHDSKIGGAPMSPQIARRVIQHFQSPRPFLASPARDLGAATFGAPTQICGDTFPVLPYS
jgi:hypothetical protein